MDLTNEEKIEEQNRQDFLEKYIPKIEEFKKELEKLINIHCLDGFTNTPDFILAEYLVSCVYDYEEAKSKNENWHRKIK